MGKGSEKKILIVDDTLPLRIMLSEILSEAGYSILVAGDGLEAWNLISSQHKELDLVILDLLLPRMSGFEVLARLKQEFPERKFPVFVLTGVFKSEKEIQRLKELGANGYLNKTSVLDEILYRVNALFYPVNEARQHPRVIYSLPVDYRFNGVRHSCYTTTLSLGGCFIRTLKPAPKDALVNLWIMIPGCECIDDLHAKGKVVWHNDYYSNYKPNTPPGMGVKFLELNERLRDCIQEIVEQKLEEEKTWQDC